MRTKKYSVQMIEKFIYQTKYYYYLFRNFYLVIHSLNILQIVILIKLKLIHTNIFISLLMRSYKEY